QAVCLLGTRGRHTRLPRDGSPGARSPDGGLRVAGVDGALAARAGHAEPGERGRHAGHSVEMFRDRFWISLALTVPTLIWSEPVQSWLGYRAPAIPGSAYLPAVFGTAVFVYGGRVFVQGAVRELRSRQPGMMTLIALAIVVAR